MSGFPSETGGDRLARLDEALSAVRIEVVRAMEKFDPFASSHEGWAVIREEVDELWDEVKANRGYDHSAAIEAKQTAAMALRYLIDLGLVSLARLDSGAAEENT